MICRYSVILEHELQKNVDFKQLQHLPVDMAAA